VVTLLEGHMSSKDKQQQQDNKTELSITSLTLDNKQPGTVAD
jgi:hypothetical protein